jgi:hypothetical protein
LSFPPWSVRIFVLGPFLPIQPKPVFETHHRAAPHGWIDQPPRHQLRQAQS